MLVSESLNSRHLFENIRFSRDPRSLKHRYPVFNTLTFAQIANALQRATPDVFIGGKLDLNRFHRFLKATEGYNRGFEKMKDTLLEAAPYLGIVKYLKLPKDDKQALVGLEKLHHGEISLDEIENAVIPYEEANEESDYVVRSADGDTEPIFFRFGRALREPEINQLKYYYAYMHGDPEKTLWRNYLDTRPITKKNVEKEGKSMYYTRDPEEYQEGVYV